MTSRSAQLPHERAGLTATRIEAALPVVHAVAPPSPLRELASLSRRIGVPLYGKLEMFQPSGSYKIRGAAFALSVRMQSGCSRDVVTFSTGNFGRAVAFVSRGLGRKCTVCVSSLVPQNKIEGLREFGAHVKVFGICQDDAESGAVEEASACGARVLSPLTDPDVYRGHGTLAVELKSQLGQLGIRKGTLIVPMSGGGLLAGVASYCRARLPQLHLVGASMARGAAMFESLVAGRPVRVPELPTIADSLGGSVGGMDTLTVPIAREVLDEACVVSEEEIYDAIRHVATDENLMCEGAAAVPIAAAARFAKHRSWPTPVIVLVTGRNIDAQLHAAIVADAGLRQKYRQRDVEWHTINKHIVDHWSRESGGAAALEHCRRDP